MISSFCVGFILFLKVVSDEDSGMPGGFLDLVMETEFWIHAGTPVWEVCHNDGLKSKGSVPSKIPEKFSFGY